MLMILGNFIFKLDTLAPSETSRNLEISAASQSRYKGRPAIQFTGVKGETLSLSGVLFPKSRITGTAATLEAARDMAIAGESHLLARGNGNVEGMFMIQSVSEKTTHSDRQGNPLKIGFEISLIRTDDERVFRAAE